MLTRVRIAAQNLAQHRRRTLLLGGAIGGVCALLILLSALGAGIRSTMLRSATTLMTGHVNVAGFYKITAGQSAPVVTDYAKIVEVVRREVPELAFVVPRGRGWGKIVSDTASQQVGINGIDVAGERAFAEVVRVVKGRLEDLTRPNTILLFESQAKRLEITVGDNLTLTSTTLRGFANTIDVRVAAIAREVGLLSSWNTFVSNATLRQLYHLNPNVTGALHLHLRDLASVAGVQARLRDVLSRAGHRVMDRDPKPFWMKFPSVNREDWTGQKLDITSWEDEVWFMARILTILRVLTVGLTVILGVIIVIGIMNTMWIAIRERTREIGTLRAIGMQRGAVMSMFLVEAIVLGLLGTAAGAAAAATLAAVLNGAGLHLPTSVQVFLMRDTLWLEVRPETVAAAVGGITLGTALSALYPAYRAAKLRPITAIHHVG